MSMNSLKHHLVKIFLLTSSKVSVCKINEDKLECGPMPNVMVALPNIGGALCSMPQSLADADYLTSMQ